VSPQATGDEPHLLDAILAQEVPAFAMLHRPDGSRPRTVDILTGDVTLPASLADIALPQAPSDGSGPAHEVVVLIPFRQIADRGFAAHDDGTPLIAMTVTEQETVMLSEICAKAPNVPATLTGSHFDVADDRYGAMVDQIVADEIGAGNGSNFVIKRAFVADIGDFSRRTAVSLFCRLLEREQGAYWIFILHAAGRTLIGATPERHISVRGGTAVMNPISGTYRYPRTGPTLSGVTDFLANRKETDELYMVLDEELKMMARICPAGGRVVGPFLKEMTRLAHTEYLIEGRTSQDVRRILHETMFAPTVTGSPLESAARVIRRHEPDGRGYYGGVAALIGHDANGERTLDSAILIRTADIDPGGRMRIGVGATLVRHSDPALEVAETRAKVSGLLGAWAAEPDTRFGDHPQVRAALARRNTGIAEFWMRDSPMHGAEVAELAGLQALVVDVEDSFTAMLGQQLSALGMSVRIRRFDEPLDFHEYDLTVLGPGPGDPHAINEAKIARLWSATDTLLSQRRPFLAVCLSHQVLSLRLGLGVSRRLVPNQGLQREIDLFGTRVQVGFYNTFAAHSAEDKIDFGEAGPVDVSRDRETGEVHALRGLFFGSFQFHAESVLTVGGPRILAKAVRDTLGR
jgi:2-amino-4-deoxychorismate synthase